MPLAGRPEYSVRRLLVNCELLCGDYRRNGHYLPCVVRNSSMQTRQRRVSDCRGALHFNDNMLIAEAFQLKVTQVMAFAAKISYLSTLAGDVLQHCHVLLMAMPST